MMPVRAWKATYQRQNKIPVPESPKPSRLREVLFCIFRKTALAPLPGHSRSEYVSIQASRKSVVSGRRRTRSQP
ncbi:hypothetical protein FSD31_25890 [Salmonella enterica]|nr:hypothetical protein [Salmonella enterica]